MEIFGGYAGTTATVSADGFKCAFALDCLYGAYGQSWNLVEESCRARFRWLVCDVLRPRATHTALPCGVWGALSALFSKHPQAKDWHLANLTMDLLEHQQSSNCLATFEGPLVHALLRTPEWRSRFGSPEEPVIPWRYTKLDGCQAHTVWPDPETPAEPTKKPYQLMSNFSLAAMAVRCRAGAVPAGLPSLAVTCGANACCAAAEGCVESDLDEVDDAIADALPTQSISHHETLEFKGPWTPMPFGPTAAIYSTTPFNPEDFNAMPSHTPDSVFTDTLRLTPAQRKDAESRIGKEQVEAEVYWDKCIAACEWDCVEAPLNIFRFGPPLTTNPRRTPEYTKLVEEALKIDEPDALKHLSAVDAAALRDQIHRKASAFYQTNANRGFDA